MVDSEDVRSQQCNNGKPYPNTHSVIILTYIHTSTLVKPFYCKMFINKWHDNSIKSVTRFGPCCRSDIMPYYRVYIDIRYVQKLC